MKTMKPMDGSGKTYFNRIKQKGQSWTKLRAEAVKRGEFTLPRELRTDPLSLK